jgi:hypothetical protein
MELFLGLGTWRVERSDNARMRWAAAHTAT